MRWKLDNIYKDFYSEEFQKDFGRLQVSVKEINQWVEEYLDNMEDAAVKIETYLKMNNEYRSIYLRLQSYAVLRESIDGQDEEAGNFLLAILERSISDAAYYIVEMYSRYIFESELFRRRKEGMLSINTVNEIMIESLKQAYGDSVDVETMNPYAWVNNIGFYFIGNEYLNFPYAFGVLFAKGLYVQYLKRGKEFVGEFKQFLKESSKMDICNVSKLININVHAVDFWNDAMKTIENDINKFIQSV